MAKKTKKKSSPTHPIDCFFDPATGLILLGGDYYQLRHYQSKTKLNVRDGRLQE